MEATERITFYTN